MTDTNTPPPDVIIDKTIVEQPIANYTSSNMFPPANITDISTNTSTLTGGTIGSQGPIFLGSPKFRLDGKEQRVVINDGAFNRVLIGKRADGTYGIDVSYPGFDALTGIKGELALSSGDPTDWTPLVSNNFAPNGTPYSGGHGFLSVANYTPSNFFVRGTLLRLKQGNNPSYQYYYITDVNDSLRRIRVTAGDDYPLTMDTIIELSYSNKAMATGFPSTFRFNSVLTASGAMTITNATTPASFCEFSIVGGTVYMNNSWSCTLGGTPDFFVTQTIPFSLYSLDAGLLVPRPSSLTNAGTPQAGAFLINWLADDQISYQRIYDPSFKWSVGDAAGNSDTFFKYRYPGGA